MNSNEMESKRNSNCWYHEVCQMDCSCDSCIRFTEMQYLMEHSGLPKSKQKPIELVPDDVDYDSFVKLQSIKDNIVDFVSDGKNLYICGGTGNGKTSWAIKILLKYFNEVWAGNGLRIRGVFVHIPTLLLKLKDFNNPLSQEYKQSILDADLVVWDEIGGTGVSNYDYSQLLMYLDNRILNDKSNIYTSNLTTYQELANILGERLASRISASQTKIVLKGRDRR